LAALWIGALVFLWLGTRAPTDVIFSTGDILARYLLGLPAAALACLGLLGQRREILEAGYTRIAGYLLGAAISLGFFGLVGVLLAVAGPFYPGEWLAYPAVLYTIGVFVPVLRALDGLVLAFFTGRALEVFEAETEARVVEMERRNLLLADRERISRELHDGTIQSLYAAGLRLEDACLTISEAPEDAQDKVRGVMDNLNQTIEEIRAYIFDLRKMQQQDGLIQRISELVQELRLNTMLETAFYVRGVRCAVPPERVTHLAQIVQECLSNTVRHAHAHLVAVNLHISPETLRVEIEDDGLGFDVEKAARQSNGMGLRTMGERVALLGGHLQVLSRPGAGTRIEVEVPCLCEPESVEENPSDGICTLANPDCG
jgi:signal transduction histidine kinase